LHDAVQCEQEGVPATVVITSAFPPIAETTARTLGVPGYHYIVVEHPIWTRTDEWMAATAAAVCDDVVRQLTVQAPTMESADSAPGSPDLPGS
jgi:hypothetical protein